MTVAPLTAAVLAGSERDAGIASGVNNAVARVAGLLGTAAVGAAISSAFAASIDSHLSGARLGSAAESAVGEAKRLPLGKPSVHGLAPGQAHTVQAAAEAASLHAFHLGMAIAAGLVAAGGVIGFALIRNPSRAPADVKAGECGGGQLVGSPNVPEEAGAAAAAGLSWGAPGRGAPTLQIKKNGAGRIPGAVLS